MLLFAVIPRHAVAEFTQEKLEIFNADLNRINQLRSLANPEARELDVVNAEKNIEFFEDLREQLSSEDYKSIVAEINSVNENNAQMIEDHYLANIESSKKMQLSSNDAGLLKELISASNQKMNTGVDLLYKANPINKTEVGSVSETRQPSMTDVAVQAIKLDSSAEVQNSNILADVSADEEVFYDWKTNQNPTERDSLFDRVSKAYRRNFNKLRIKK